MMVCCIQEARRSSGLVNGQFVNPKAKLEHIHANIAHHSFCSPFVCTAVLGENMNNSSGLFHSGIRVSK